MSGNRSKTIRDPTTSAKQSRANFGAKNLNFGKVTSAETLTKRSAAQGTIIFVYNSNGSLVNTFISVRKAEKFFNCSPTRIKKYVMTNQMFQDKQILFLQLKNKQETNVLW